MKKQKRTKKQPPQKLNFEKLIGDKINGIEYMIREFSGKTTIGVFVKASKGDRPLADLHAQELVFDGFGVRYNGCATIDFDKLINNKDGAYRLPKGTFEKAKSKVIKVVGEYYKPSWGSKRVK